MQLGDAPGEMILILFATSSTLCLRVSFSRNRLVRDYMSGIAVVLVLTAALIHAMWNFLAKRASGGMPFVWLSEVCSIVIYSPLVLIIIALDRPKFDLIGIVFIFGTALLHLAYFLLLNWGYQVGDLSVVYPIARGTGPMLSTLGAIILLNERPTWLALVGAFLIVLGVFGLVGDPRMLKQGGTLTSIAYALLTGISIAAYTLWDKVAVSDLELMPIVFLWLSHIIRLTILTPFALPRRDDIRTEWRNHARYVISVAILSPIAYVLVLTALVFSPVSYVAPMRESSTLIGTIMGTRLLHEDNTLQRSLAALAVFFGIIALGLA